MNFAETIAALPAAGWAAVFLLIAVLGAFLFGLCRVLLKKDVRLRGLELFEQKEREEERRELKEEIRESARHLAADLVSSQYATALNLLQKLRIDIYEAGLRRLGLEDEKERLLLLDMAWVIEARVAREVLLDLVRNHISGKSRAELLQYSEAKADGYWRRIKTDLFSFAPQLPGKDLPSLMDCLPAGEFRKLFEDVYTSACRIAGGEKEEVKND